MWSKKNKEFKGKNYYYSLKSQLQADNKIDNDFELLLNNLTLTPESENMHVGMCLSFIDN